MNNIFILAVDDEPMNIALIEELVKGIGKEIVLQSFLNPVDALKYLIENPVDIMLTDFMMPDINGAELIERGKILRPEMLSIIITGSGDNETIKLQALKAGANDFLTKPLHISEFQLRIKNLLTLKKSQKILNQFNKELQYEIKKATQDLISREYETLLVLSKTAEYKDPETASHIARVAHYSKLIAKHYGLNENEQEKIFHASPLHDLGKIGIRDDVLLKPGKLDDKEFEHMKRHPLIGYEILKGTQNHFLEAGAIISLNHHEKFDGSGYPNGLKGEEIHIYGRITAIADVFDALTSNRPYKRAWSFDEAIVFLTEQRGKHFDPILVDLFILKIDDVKKIYHNFESEE
jgi:response regulator RpfG family c-di-GMP phosphodiesterase